ncbi:CCR4-NOT transcription complex subunit 4 [Trichonephila clavipes]|nr:CCR4-NOT transcription complex subunit 4 [Trichonephila clavipes]
MAFQGTAFVPNIIGTLPTQPGPQTKGFSCFHNIEETWEAYFLNLLSLCPLCLETLDIDDLSFYPCKCGYQVCRFCWHRIRTNENGLCPACRRQYSEDPVTFKPLTQEE